MLPIRQPLLILSTASTHPTPANHWFAALMHEHSSRPPRPATLEQHIQSPSPANPRHCSQPPSPANPEHCAQPPSPVNPQHSLQSPQPSKPSAQLPITQPSTSARLPNNSENCFRTPQPNQPSESPTVTALDPNRRPSQPSALLLNELLGIFCARCDVLDQGIALLLGGLDLHLCPNDGGVLAGGPLVSG